MFGAAKAEPSKMDHFLEASPALFCVKREGDGGAVAQALAAAACETRGLVGGSPSACLECVGGFVRLLRTVAEPSHAGLAPSHGS